MDQATLASVLQLALSADPGDRRAGEERLNSFQYVPGHLVGLMQIVVRTDCDLPIRQIASIYFKNLVSKDWRPADGTPEKFSQDDKVTVRNNILEAIICAPTQIRAQLVEVLRTVVVVDYPLNWPSLLAAVDANLKARDEQRTHGALLALRLISRKYEFKDTDEREPLNAVVDHMFPILLDIFKYLVALPTPTLEIAILLKLVCKIFWSCSYLQIPKPLRDDRVFLEWMACFFALLERPVPIEGQPLDPEVRKNWAWWKLRKWLLTIINRLFTRFGDPKHEKGENKQWALMFQTHCSCKFLETYMRQLSSIRGGGYVPDRIVNLTLQYITSSIVLKDTYQVLKPHLGVLLSEIIFPLMCFNTEDDALWKEDPHEYVRKGYDIMEDMYSGRTAAINFVTELVSKRAKDNLAAYLQSIVTVFNNFEAAPPTNKPYREKDGALLAVGSLSEKLKRTQPYAGQLEHMLKQYVYPEFSSPAGHLRAKAAWVSGQYADIEFKDDSAFTHAMSATVGMLRDPDLPCRVDAVVALRTFVEAVEELTELRRILPQLLDELFKLMSEVESEDMVFTLETIVDKFGEEMAPYAMGLVTNLTQTFWKCIELAEAEDDEDDTGALAAVGCLRAIATILESISSLPHLYPQLEPTLLPLMTKMLTSDGQDVYEEILEICSYYTYFSPTITPQMWAVWPLIMAAMDDWALDYFNDIISPLDNFIARGTETFLGSENPNYPESLYRLIAKVLSDEESQDEDVEAAPKLLESVLQNCRGRVDQWVAPYLQLAVARLRVAKTSYAKDLLMGVVGNALYYNARLTLDSLQKLGCLGEVFRLWLTMLYAEKKGKGKHFKREHLKKVCILALLSLLSVPAKDLPGEVQAMLGEVLKAALRLLAGYKEQVALREKMEEEEEANEDVEDSDGDDDDGEEIEEVEEEEEGIEKGTEIKTTKKHPRWLEAEEDGHLESDSEDEDDLWDEEEYQCPMDEVDPYIFFQDVMKGLSTSDPQTFDFLTKSLDFHHQALAHGLATHADAVRKQHSELTEAAKLLSA